MVKIIKQLAGVQDLMVGNDALTQVRNGQEVPVTGVSGDTLPLAEANGATIRQAILDRYTKSETDDKYAVLVQDNWTATTAPTASTDATLGYGPGSLWAYVAGVTTVYICVDATPGNAVWVAPLVTSTAAGITFDKTVTGLDEPNVQAVLDILVATYIDTALPSLVFDELAAFDARNYSKPLYIEELSLYFKSSGVDGGTLTSLDGEAWSLASSIVYIYLEYIADFNLVVLVDEKGRMYSTADGVVFTQRTPSSFPTNYNAWLYTCHIPGDGLYYLSVGNNALAKTTDGETWTRIMPTGAALPTGTSLTSTPVQYSPQQGLFFFVHNAAVYSSPDFEEWTLTMTTFITNSFYAIDPAGNLVLYGTKAGFTPALASMYGGVVTDIITADMPPEGARFVRFDPLTELYLTIGTSMKLGTSADLRSWRVQDWEGTATSTGNTNMPLNRKGDDYIVFAAQGTSNLNKQFLLHVVADADRLSFRPTGQLVSKTVGGAINELDQTIQTYKDTLLLQETITYTVGASGDYPSIGEAITALEALKVAKPLVEGIITILSGHAVEEQIVVINKDLGWITLEAQDSVVQIDSSSLTQLFRSKAPFIHVENGTSPVVAAVFDMGGRPLSGPANVGLSIIGPKSYCEVKPSCGFIMAEYGLVAHDGAKVWAQGATFRYNQFGVYSTSAATVYILGGTTTLVAEGIGSVGMAVQEGGIIHAVGATGTVPQVPNEFGVAGIIYN